jgi:hypothetical protein
VAVALAGVIEGRGTHGSGLDRLGVFLDHNPQDFGIQVQQIRPGPDRMMRTTAASRTSRD